MPVTPKDRSTAKGIKPDILITSGKETKDESSMKESDLKGHIAGNDLSNVSQKGAKASAFMSWPEHYKRDRQLKTAFNYMLGWRKFDKN